MTILDRFRVDGRTAIVTGASSGLGVAFAQALAEAGADVALGARRAERLGSTRELVEAAGRRAIAVPTDVSVPEDCDRLVQEAIEAFGKVDILVNNAGVGTARPALKETPEEFRAVIDVDLTGSFILAKAALPLLARAEHPALIFVSSLAGIRGRPGAAHLCAAKAGVIGLARSLAMDLYPHGIRVNAIAPGPVQDVERGEPSPLPPGAPADVGISRPADVANVALFLAS
ncbi:MAG: SDR family oxidoreductase, partial [Acidimicrobiia bacterium]|nr:SDR family oxidoreductase [Acidimicrobiia bacterium]